MPGSADIPTGSSAPGRSPAHQGLPFLFLEVSSEPLDGDLLAGGRADRDPFQGLPSHGVSFWLDVRAG